MSALHQQQLGSDLLSASAGLSLPTLHLCWSHRCLGSVHPPTRVWVRGEGEHSLGEGGCSAAVCRALSPPQSQKSFGVLAQVAAWHQHPHPPQSLHGKGGTEPPAPSAWCQLGTSLRWGNLSCKVKASYTLRALQSSGAALREGRDPASCREAAILF